MLRANVHQYGAKSKILRHAQNLVFSGFGLLVGIIILINMV